MLRLFSITSALVAALISSSALALAPELVQKGESATALVCSGNDQMSRQLGSAFCVSRTGIFITTAHLRGREGESVRLVFSPGQKSRKIVNAKVIRVDTDSNLAVLQSESSDGLVPLKLANTDKLYDTMDVTAFGYPVLGGYVRNAQEFPAISANTGHITSLEKKADVLDRIVTDVTLTRGDAGGPVLDSDGAVIGVVDVGGITNGFGNHAQSFVIPAGRLRKLLLKPALTLKTPSLPYGKRHDEQQLTVGVTSLSESAPDYEVELAIRVSDQPPRTFKAEVLDGEANFSFVPLPATGDNAVSLKARFEKGTLSGTITNRSFHIGDRSVKLDAVKQIERTDENSDATVTLRTGEQLTGKLSGLDNVSLDVGNAKANVDLSRATNVSVDEPERPVRQLGYTITVRVKEDIVVQTSGSIDFADAPPFKGDESLSESGPHIDIGSSIVTPPGMAIRTPLLGGPGGELIDIRCPETRDVIGFSYKMSVWADRPILQKIVPLYNRGHAAADETVLAKDGYVVGGILVDSDLYTHAVRVIFMKMDAGKLNPKDNYVSDWMGVPVSGQLPKQLAGHGERVIGVTGRKGINMDAIGLIIIP